MNYRTAVVLGSWLLLPPLFLAATLLFLLFPEGRLLSRRWVPVVWVLLGEMFPNRMRAAALSLAAGGQWVANWIITVTFPGLKDPDTAAKHVDPLISADASVAGVRQALGW